jgi:hypothetical protein
MTFSQRILREFVMLDNTLTVVAIKSSPDPVLL